MKEIMSPEVKFIPGWVPFSDVRGVEIKGINLHPLGIIEINTNMYDLDTMVRRLFDMYAEQKQVYRVSVTGHKNSDQNKVAGSSRFCAWDASFAKLLTEIIEITNAVELVDLDHGPWQFEAVSKYFRFMRYASGGEHFPHFDSDFVVNRAKGTFGQKVLYATKYSLVAYFNTCTSGEIAFIATDDTNRDDWTRQAYENEIFLKIKPQAGKIVLFPHNVCHTVLPFTDDGHERLIARGDLIFTKVI